MMNGSTIVFYLLAALTLGCAILSVSTRHIFRAAIYLLFTLIGIAGIYFWLQYEFIAAVQVVVYVGGIVVLIIFSIFLTQQAGEKMARQRIGRKIFAALAAFCGFALTLLQVYKQWRIQ
jgi:NADH-quinone oxidoreductase subunit J